MSLSSLGLAFVLVVVSETTATEKFLGTFPKSANSVSIRARMVFIPSVIKADKEFIYERGSCSSAGEKRPCTFAKLDLGLKELTFQVPNTLNLSKLEIRGDRTYEVSVVYREPLEENDEDYAISPRHSLPIAHYAPLNAKSVEVNCAVKLPQGVTSAKITICTYGEIQCTTDGSKASKCRSQFDPKTNIFTAFYSVSRTHNTFKSAYDVLCVADGPKTQSYISKYVEFPERGGGYTGKYGQNSSRTIWFKTWFKPVEVRSLRTYQCSGGRCRAGSSQSSYVLKRDKIPGVWNFYLESDPQRTRNWVTVHGEKEEEVVVSFLSTYWQPILAYAFSPIEVRNLVHYPFDRSEEVVIECPVRYYPGFDRPKVVVYDNGEEKCSYGDSDSTECESRRGSANNILVIVYRVNFEDDPDSIARHILCTSTHYDKCFLRTRLRIRQKGREVVVKI
ncbi:hypothetical protein SprV_0301280200 [Sparganum proliferum]